MISRPRFLIILFISVVWAMISIVLGNEVQDKIFIVASKQIRFSGFDRSIGIGGLDGCPFPYYDNQGHALESVNLNGILPPVFSLSPLIISPTMSISPGVCFAYPDSINPGLLAEGKSYYPLLMEIEIPRTWISPGESIILTVSSRIEDDFQDGSRRVLLAPEQAINVQYQLASTTFAFAPMDTPVQTLSVTKPVEQTWIISPNEGVLGKQNLLVRLDSDMWAGEIGVFEILDFEVRNLNGIDPTLIAYGTMLITFFGGIITILKVLETISKLLYGQPPEVPSKSSPKRRKTRKPRRF